MRKSVRLVRAFGAGHGVTSSSGIGLRLERPDTDWHRQMTTGLSPWRMPKLPYSSTGEGRAQAERGAPALFGEGARGTQVGVAQGRLGEVIRRGR